MLEELFPGVARDKEFSRVEEYIFFVKMGASSPVLSENNMLYNNEKQNAPKGTTWLSLQRSGSSSLRVDRPNMCYPFFVDEKAEKIVDVGYVPDLSVPISSLEFDNGLTAVWPMTLGREGRWQLGRDTVVKYLEKGIVKLGNKQKDGHWTIQYLNAGALKEIDEGAIVVKGYGENGAMIVERVATKLTPAKTVWNHVSHDASVNGSGLLLKIFNDKEFAFPKSLYSTYDAINYFVKNKPNAVILDFFAGSGTTLHAVNLMNKQERRYRMGKFRHS